MAKPFQVQALLLRGYTKATIITALCAHAAVFAGLHMWPSPGQAQSASKTVKVGCCHGPVQDCHGPVQPRQTDAVDQFVAREATAIKPRASLDREF